MVDTIESVASAVVLPEIDETPSTDNQATTGQKRRQSSVSSTSSKRPRLSTDINADNVEASPDGPPEERRRSRQISGQAEERKRGQRLFGGLLSALSQSSRSKPGAAARERRKAEIEQKQADKLKLRDEEYSEEKKKKLDELTRVRKREQWVWDEQAMRTRHSNSLAAARYLQTESEPKLYYKPWAFQSDEEDRIEKQIANAEAQIDQEIAEFQENKRKWQEENNERAERANIDLADTIQNDVEQNGTGDDDQEVPNTVGDKPTPSDAATKPTNIDTANSTTDGTINGDQAMPEEVKDSASDNGTSREAPDDDNMKDAGEENVDHVDEGEDAVIY